MHGVSASSMVASDGLLISKLFPTILMVVFPDTGILTGVKLWIVISYANKQSGAKQHNIIDNTIHLQYTADPDLWKDE